LYYLDILHFWGIGEMYTQRLVVGCATIAVALLFRTEAGFATQPQKSQSRVAAVLENITNLNRPGQDGYATVWDGNKYVQCKRLSDRNLRCEAAGSLMQSSLGHVLTPERVARLTALGWRLDPSFGNYVQTFPADAASSLVADKILQTLGEAYEADVADIEVQSTWIPSEPCPSSKRAQPKFRRYRQQCTFHGGDSGLRLRL